jgi:hypothetical protein
MFNGSPGTFYMDWIASLIESGITIDQLYEIFSIDPSWQAIDFGFTDAATNEQFAEAFVDQVTGDTLSDENRDWAIDFIAGLVDGGMTRGEAMHLAIDALDAVPHDNEGFGAAAALFDNRVEVARHFTEDLSGNVITVAQGQAVIASVDETEESVVQAKAENAAAVNPPPTLTFTSDIDNLKGSTSADVFKGTINNDGADDASTVQTGDFADGSGGDDTLELTVAADQGTAPLLETASIETVKIRQLDGGANAIDASLWAGVTRIESSKSLESLDVENVGNSVVAAATKANSDNGADFDITYADDALGSDEATQKIVVDGVGSGSEEYDIRFFGGGDDTITTLEVEANGDDSVVDVWGDLIDGFIETLTVTGTAALEIQDDAGSFDEATVIDLSGNSGGVTLEASHEELALTGGSGDDEITLSNGVALVEGASIDLGAGDDSLLDGGSAGVGTETVLDGGEGSDTIASTLLEVGNQANIKNWEVLDIADDNRTIDASLFKASTFESLAKTDALAGDVTVTKLAGTKIVVDDTSASNDGFTLIAVLATATGTADSAEINFNGDGDTTMANFTTAGLESIAIDSQSENDGDANAINQIRTLDNVLTKITITGDKDFTLGGVITNSPIPLPNAATADVASSLTSIDGSAATGDLTITAGANSPINLVAPIFNTTYNSLNIKTGSGDDTVSIGGRGSVSTGEGEDTVNVARLGVSVDVGADEDFDLVTLAATADFNVAFDPTTRVTTITNLAEDDEVDFSALASGAATLNDFTTDALTFASLETAVNAALADGTSAVDFFNWVDGNTYIVVNGTDDTVIKLTGTYTDFAFAADVVTIG